MSAPSQLHTVLVVDDEPAIRELMRRFLKEEGYRLLEAPNGAKALEVAQGYDAQINVLVTDMVMPQMDGLTLASKVTSQRSETRVLFVTGHANDDQDVRNALRWTPHNFLLKPFTSSALARKIERLLLTRQGVGPSQRPTAARFVKAIPVLYLPSGQTDWLRGMTVDVSDSGILLEAVSPLAIESRLDVTLDASEAFGHVPRGTVHRHGRVVRHGTPTASIPHPVGIQFLAD